MIRSLKLPMLLFSFFTLFIFTSAYAQDKLVNTPYFQVNLPQEIVLRKVAISPSKTGKTYLFSKQNQNGVTVDYIFGFFVQELDKNKAKNKDNFLEKDVIDTYVAFADKHDRSLKENDPKKYIKNIKIGDLTFKMLRTPGSRMETLATVHNGQFYRVFVTSDDPKNMDMLHKRIIESLQLTNTRATQNTE